MELSIEIEIAFMNQIESAAQGWKDGTQSYREFRTILRQMCENIYQAGQEPTKRCHVCGVLEGEPHKSICSVGNGIYRP